MSVASKNILNRLYVVVLVFLVIAMFIVYKLFSIQYVHGDKYRELALQRTVKKDVIKANRGSIYADDGSLLATSVPKYDIRFDAVTVSKNNFTEHLAPLCDSLALMLGKNASYYKSKLKRARRNKNRYTLIARNLGYSDYIKIKNFPIFNLGAYKGGIIVEGTAGNTGIGLKELMVMSI